MRRALSCDIHLGGCPGGVFNFIFTTLAGDINKRTLDLDSRAWTTPGTIEKGQKFEYDKLSLICIINL